MPAYVENPTLCQAVVEHSAALIGVGDLTGIRFLSPSVAASLGWVSGLPSPLALADGLVHAEDRERVGRAMSDAAASGRAEVTHVRLRHSDGSYLSLDCVVQDLRDDERVGGFLMQAWDVTAREQAYERAALYDPLTGLPNRVLFLDRLARALRAQQRHSGRVGVIYLDLDDFKGVNDQHGHRVGDEVLREVGRRLSTAVRPGDTAARLSGDEFVVLCEQLADIRSGYDVARRVGRSLEPPIVVDDVPVRVRASMGVALALDPLVSPDQLVAKADDDMYADKRQRARAERERRPRGM